MMGLYREIENPLVVVLARMEHVGIAVDRKELEALNARLTADVQRLGLDLRARLRARRPERQLDVAAPRDPVRPAAAVVASRR